MAPASRQLIEALIAERGWMQRLARGLVGSEAAAEELVQEAWITALRSPPDEHRPVRPWLRQVLRNLARMRWRGDDRRARREQLAAEPQAGASPEQLVARVALERRLADLVLGLDEPLRHAVLLRYVEGLNATQIAEREGVAAPTVRWRLKRALDLLRERLDVDADGDRRRWQLALVPAPIAPAKSGLLGGALTMTVATKTTVAVAAVVIVAIAALTLSRLSSRSSAITPPESVPPADSSATDAADKSGETDDVAATRDRSSGLRRLAGADERARLERQIADARERRLALAARTDQPSIPQSASRPELDQPEGHDRDYIQERMQELIPLIKECYTMALERDPTLSGTLIVDLTLVGEPDVGGLVGSSEVDPEESTLLEDGMSECVRETMYALEIDPPTGGGEVRVRYPFLFTNDD